MPSDRCPEETEVLSSRVRSSPLADAASVEERASQSEDRFRLAIECADHAVWDLDLRTGGGYVNPGYFRMLGYEPDSFVETYDQWCERLHPDDRQRVVQKFEDYLAGRIAAYAAEFRQRSATGDWVWIRSSGKIVERDSSGQAVRVIGTFTDISTLKETQAALEETQHRLRQALKIARLGRWTWEPETGATWWSDEIFSLYGFDPREFEPSYESYLNRVDSEDRAMVMREHDSIRLLGEAMAFDARIILPDGQVRWINTIAKAVRDAAGRLVRLDGVDQDITDRKQVELALQASEARFRTFVEHATDAFFLHTEGGAILDVNQCGCDSLGFTRDELVGRHISELDPDVTEEMLADMQRRLAAGETVAFESRHRRKDGTCFPVEVRIRPFEDRGRMLAVALARDVSERTRADAALRESEAKLRAIFESEPECVKVLDAEGRLLEMNPAGLSMIGAESIDAVRSLPIADVICPEYREEFRQGVADVFCGQQTLQEFELVSLDGVRRHVEQRAVGLRDPQHPERISQMLAVTRDVSERRRMEDREARRVEKLKLLSESALPLAGEPDDVFENVLRIISDVFDVRIVCLSAIDGQNLVLRSAWIDGRLQRNIRRCPLAATPCGAAAAARRVWTVDRVAERFPDAAFLQEHRAYSYCGSPVICAVGNVVGVVFLLDDKAREFTAEDEHILQLFGQRVALEFDREKGLAARRDAEEVLLQNQRRLSEAQRIAHIGDWIWDLPSDKIAWSDEVYRIFGHEPQSFVPHYEVEFLQAIHPDNREGVVEAVASALDGGTSYEVVHRIVRPDGTERTVRERGEASYDAAGVPIRMVGTVQDITESTLALEQTETLRNELAHVARLGMLGEMVAGIAHELNQPLAAIANNAFTVRRTLEKLSHTASGALLDNALIYTQVIETQSVRGGDIIRRLITLLRKTGSHRSTVSLRKLIDEVLFLLATEIRVTQVDVAIAVPEELPEVIVDSVQIQQVLFNVIRNAIEAMTGQSRGRQLRIHAEAKSDRVILVRVLDTGPGFSADIEQRIFTPFATTKSDGLGFGLAITKRIVEAHGGEIGIRSKFGHGAEVCFTLPTSGVAGEDVDAR